MLFPDRGSYLYITNWIIIHYRYKEMSNTFSALRFKAIILLTGLGICLPACRRDGGLPDPSSDAYRETVTAFYSGLAAIQSSSTGAEERLLRATELAPAEPSPWANLGILALRQNEMELAAERLERARSLAPESSEIVLLIGLMENIEGDVETTMNTLQQAVDLDPSNIRALFALAQVLERSGDDPDGSGVKQLMDDILRYHPENMAVLFEQMRLAVEHEDAETLQRMIGRLSDATEMWPEQAKELFEGLKSAASASDFNSAVTQVAFMKNVLLRYPEYRQSLSFVQAPAEQVSELIMHFILLPSPTAYPSPPDDSLTFAAEIVVSGSDDWENLFLITLDEEARPTIFPANGREVFMAEDITLDFPGGSDHRPPSLDGIVGLDYNYDFRMDLAFAGDGGFRLFHQDSLGVFSNITDRIGQPSSITDRSYSGAWAVDIDLEGDIDLVLATPQGSPIVLRNNTDGTFTLRETFSEVNRLRAFAWADIDADGDPDAALIDADKRLHIYENKRAGQLRPRALSQPVNNVLTVNTADIDRNAVIDLVVLKDDGAILRMSNTQQGTSWQIEEIARWDGIPDGLESGTTRLFIEDLDNNGGIDLLVSTTQGSFVWLGDEGGVFVPLAAAIKTQVYGVADLSEDGRLDMLTVAETGEAVILVNQSTKQYQWNEIRPRAAYTMGDQRINSYGIGGEIEIRSGLLFQKQSIQGPVVHFGLGNRQMTDVARIIWPNGDVQAEFEMQANELLLTRQRLKGSCPWLFTYDGTGMQFVTDFIWRSPLGMKINAQETADVMTTEDWVKIRGDQLVPHDGYYDIRITAELWETHFFDHVSLMVVDHPSETDIFVDERFVLPPPALKTYTTTRPEPVARVWDDHGDDVTDFVRTLDGRYLDTFGRGTYQGVTREHYIEIELGDHVPQIGPLWLIASGWLHPTDSSINVALGQGDHERPTGLSVRVPDGQGGWIPASADLGFPAGKTKTILIDLEHVFLPNTPRTIRLYTNLEIYWDALGWATKPAVEEIKTERLLPQTAELRYYGFSEIYQADKSSPELPVYGDIMGTDQMWRDLVGYYTRFGDVRELLVDIDDRYVIMNAGDEMIFRFPVTQSPPDGWTRDFVLIGDGWVKDGDYNTAFSKTVLPLPSHDQPSYNTPPGDLEEDPVYFRYPEDWKHYHTRYVSSDRFQYALVQ